MASIRGGLFLILLFVGCCYSDIIADHESSCDPHDIDVRDSVGVSAVMHGVLCKPQHFSSTIVVLVHGASYNGYYWDFEFQPDTYNFRKYINGKGFATYTIDLLGNGKSSKLASNHISGQVNAGSIHQSIDFLRSQGWEKVVLCGHSLGSAISINEASTYKDIDGLILTGYVHAPEGYQQAAKYMHNFELAKNVERFSHLDDYFMVTTPAGRKALFYHDNAIDEVIDYDIAHMDVFAVTNLEVMSLENSRNSKDIEVPVLFVLGQHDFCFCSNDDYPAICAGVDALTAWEAHHFVSSSNFTVYLVADNGHNLNLHPNAPIYFETVSKWLADFSLPSVLPSIKEEL